MFVYCIAVNSCELQSAITHRTLLLFLYFCFVRAFSLYFQIMKSPCDICSPRHCACLRHSPSAYTSPVDFVRSEKSPMKLRQNVTPDRRNISRLSPLKTIKDSPCSKSCSFVSTPLRSYRMPTNPFDVEVDSLQTSSFSPSIFAMTKKESERSSFRWSIEQLAVLKPADIDETSQQDIHVDWEKEAKAQKAIDTFFSKNHIVPSPWAPTIKYMSFSPNLASTAYQCSKDFHRSPDAGENDCNCSMAGKTTSTQTMITIPPNLDLMSLLGPFCTYQSECRNDSANSSGSDVDMLSTSSLRRKLFMNDNVDIPPVYGNKYEEDDDNSEDRKCFTPDKKTFQILTTPASDHFSSSPITPRNFSLSMNYPRSSMSSPNISPIRASSVKSDGSRHSLVDEDDVFLKKCGKEKSSSSELKIQDAENNMQCQSMISKSMCDNGASSFCSTEVEFYDPGIVMNPDDDGAENQTSLPDSSSTNRDTGYLTGSLSSAQSMNFQQTSGCGPVRTTPVMELLGSCAITKLQQQNNANSSAESSGIGDTSAMSVCHSADAVNPCTNEFNFGPWHPNKYSTPTKINHL